jgi:hypothetical protein
MTRAEHLTTIAMEECAELAQRLSKAQRFGLEQVQQDADDVPEQNPLRLTNRERILLEYYDLRATLGLIGIDAWETSYASRQAEQAKREKIERYLGRSRRCGTLTD